MTRTWQLSASDTVSWNQDQALNTSMFIVRESGPTCFLLKEENNAKKFKVHLGDPHSCTCNKYYKEKVPCKHICWVLLKKFHLDRYHELSYQHGLNEREINQLLYNNTKAMKVKQKVKQNDEQQDIGDGTVQQRSITDDDVCPICQEDLLTKHQSVTYCRHGCGNNVHIKCMKVWADHQMSTVATKSSNVTCPICRNDFGTYTHLCREYQNIMGDVRQLKRNNISHHIGVECNVCKMMPIKGKCFKCTSCQGYHLCNTCYHGNNQHCHDTFVYKLKPAQRWRPVESNNDVTMMDSILQPIVNELQGREITENDYETLLQLDQPSTGNHQHNGIPVDLAGLPEYLINNLPTFKVGKSSKYLLPGRQCRLCLQQYKQGQFLRPLPDCGHVFHRSCIDKWLTEDHRCCPIDRTPVTSTSRPQVERTSDHHQSRSATTNRTPQHSSSGDHSNELVVPGIGIVCTAMSPLQKYHHTTTSPQIVINGRTKKKPPVKLTNLRRKAIRSNRLLSDNDVRSNDVITQEPFDISMRDLVVTAGALSFNSAASSRGSNSNPPLDDATELPGINARPPRVPRIYKHQRPINNQANNNDLSRATFTPPTDDVFNLMIGASPSVVRKRATSLVKRRNITTNEKRERVLQQTREIDFSLDGRQWGER